VSKLALRAPNPRRGHGERTESGYARPTAANAVRYVLVLVLVLVLV